MSKGNQRHFCTIELVGMGAQILSPNFFKQDFPKNFALGWKVYFKQLNFILKTDMRSKKMQKRLQNKHSMQCPWEMSYN